jgi:hypothetical protein
MFRALRTRIHITSATAIALVALVFAMTGGAYAAGKYLITSTKQISPKVLKSLQGKSGAAGKAGAGGAAGAAGVQGPAGPSGPAGAAGVKGETGAKGENGKPGASGKEGSPWTTGGTLPSGATETGAWSVESASETILLTPISFAIPLAAPLGEAHVFFIPVEEEGKVHETECPGSVSDPKAAAGDLCVYTRVMQENLEPFSTPIGNPSEKGPTPGAATSGAILLLLPNSAAQGGAYGTWAVTAP